MSTDEPLTIGAVVRRSGHRLIRVAVERDAAETVHQEFHPLLDQEQLVHEWRGFAYVAVDLPPERDISRLSEWLNSRESAGSLWLEHA